MRQHLDSKYSSPVSQGGKGQSPPPTVTVLSDISIIQAAHPTQYREICLRREGPKFQVDAGRNIYPQSEAMRASTHRLTVNLSDRSDKIQPTGGRQSNIAPPEPYFPTSIGCPGYKFIYGSPAIGEVPQPASINNTPKRYPTRERRKPTRYRVQ